MSPRSPDPSLQRSGSNLGLFIAAWLIAFSFWFHHFTIPNNGIPRWMFWAAIPFDIMDLLDPPHVPGALPWSWFNLPQRLPFVLVAATIWLGAWGVGSLILRGLPISLDWGERLFFAMAVGMSCVSLETLLLGYCGQMKSWLMLCLLGVPCALEIGLLLRLRRSDLIPKPSSRTASAKTIRPSRIGWIVLAIAAFLIAVQQVGAMSPQTDFDVVEYHLGGPKEWYQAGRISRLPHNVYTSFPFLAEMLVLSGMIVYGDWQWGALAGQAVIAAFAPLTALGLFAAGRRWFSETVGWLSALIYLSSPWTYRISIIAYVEGGLSFYLFAALFAGLLFSEQLVAGDLRERSSGALAFLAGLLSGSAMACKYTGLIMVVIPVGLLLVGTAIRSEAKLRLRIVLIVSLLFSAGVLASIGPWLLKNFIETGNPVYPLGVRVFGGVDRTPELDAKWRQAHGAKSYPSLGRHLLDLMTKVVDVTADNDWHSPMMFGFAPLSLLLFRRRSTTSGSPEQSLRQSVLVVVWAYVVWQFLTWFCFTHLIDRFYVPMFSAVALLAGVGACWWEFLSTAGAPSLGETVARWSTCAMIAASLFYNFDVMIHGNVSGFNAGRLDLKTADQVAVSPKIAWFNSQFESGELPRDTKVICVGEALLFHARYPYLYNTVFDHSIFEQICADPESHGTMLKPAEEIREGFRRLGITHVDVNWSMVLTYREPGNYGFTSFVNPDCFAELQRLGILGVPLDLPNQIGLSPLSDQRRQLLVALKWDSSLIRKVGNEPAYISNQVFPVLTGRE